MVQYETKYGEEVWILGDQPILGKWNTDFNLGKGGIRMKWYEGHIWKVELDYQHIFRAEFKFVIKKKLNNL